MLYQKRRWRHGSILGKFCGASPGNVIQSHQMNVHRIILITILLLSLFTTAKSFIAVHNIKVWSDEVRGFMIGERLRPQDQRSDFGYYDSRLDAIQRQWTFMRWVGAGSTALSAIAVYLVSRNSRSSYHTKSDSNWKIPANLSKENTSTGD